MKNIVFINYRREDSRHLAARIYDRINQEFGSDFSFLDIDKLPYGTDFSEHIQSCLSECKVVISVIGKQWSSASTGVWPMKRLRLHNPSDWVRRELEIAKSTSRTILPVLADGALMPGQSDLPESLHWLPTLNSLTISHERFRTDVLALMDSISHLTGAVPSKHPASGREDLLGHFMKIEALRVRLVNLGDPQELIDGQKWNEAKQFAVDRSRIMGEAIELYSSMKFSLGNEDRATLDAILAQCDKESVSAPGGALKIIALHGQFFAELYKALERRLNS